MAYVTSVTTNLELEEPVGIDQIRRAAEKVAERAGPGFGISVINDPAGPYGRVGLTITKLAAREGVEFTIRSTEPDGQFGKEDMYTVLVITVQYRGRPSLVGEVSAYHWMPELLDAFVGCLEPA